MSDCYKELIDIYEDKDGIMEADLEAMKGANMFSSFYETLKNVNEYNHKFPNAVSENEIDIERIAHVSGLSIISVCNDRLIVLNLTGQCSFLWGRSVREIFRFEFVLRFIL